jgi:UMF1 family MFS transporter
MATLLQRINPFKGLPNPREVWAWGMYDLANQSFTLLINTLLFAVYFKDVVVGSATPEDVAHGRRLWGLIFAASMLVVVIISPYMGALADGRGWKKKVLVGSGFICVALTCAFGLIGPGDVLLAIALYIPANIAYQIGENFLASFLPEVSTPKNIGRVSAIGWTMGYVGALGLSIALVISLKLGMADKTDWRPLFVFAGLWFLVGMIAPMLILKEAPPVAMHKGAQSASAEAVARLKETFRDARRYAQLLRFLASFFTYGMGMQSVIAFAAIIATDIAFKNQPNPETLLFIFTILLTITAGAGAILTSKIQDRIGCVRILRIFLIVWMIALAGLATYTITANRGTPMPFWSFWIIGALIGFGLGGVGPASRATVGLFTPRHKTAEFFGLWGFTYKFAGVVGVGLFGVVFAWSDSAALALLFAYFDAGFLVLFLVNDARGAAVARQAEAEVGLAEPSHATFEAVPDNPA